MIREAGYHPVVYFNQDLGYLSYQLDRLTDYTFWLAGITPAPASSTTSTCGSTPTPASVPGIEEMWT